MYRISITIVIIDWFRNITSFLNISPFTKSISLNSWTWFYQFIFLIHLFTTLGTCHKIRPKLCTNAVGEEGRCMFVWECIKTEGKHLGTCVDGFLFGSCCGHNNSINSITNDFVSTNQVITSTLSSLINKDKWKPSTTTASSLEQTTTTTASTLKPNRPTTITSTESVFNVDVTKPYTTYQKPWIVFSGKPNPSSTIRPIIIWPISNNNNNNNHHFKPPVMSSNNSWSVILPTVKPIMVIQNNNNNNQQFAETLTQNRIPNATIATSTTTSSTSKPIIISSINATSEPSNQTESSLSSSLPSATISTNNNLENGDKETTIPPTLSIKQQCGITQVKPRTKVVGGKNSAFGAWPWQVSVRRVSFFGFSSTHRCGGAILNSQWIATAGHCVDDLLLTQIRIRVGEYDFSSSREPYPHIERAAKKKIVHPKYNFFTYENDLALVQLDEPITFLPHVSPICLPPDNIELLGKNATVTGWGRLSEGGVLPTVLQEVRVPIISNDKCKNMFLSAGRHEYIPDIFMCAGYDAGGRDSCQGDSGGPLQVQGDDGRWFLAGIISWGIGCGEPSLPGVCTRITKFKHWILSYISD